MGANRNTLATSILITAVGLGWLLTVQKVVPGVDWVWILGLGVVGLLIPMVLGIDKVTVVFCPFLVVATIFSLLRQTGRMSVDTETPGLVAVFGVLMFVAHFLPVRSPRWLIDSQKASSQEEVFQGPERRRTR